MKFGFNVIYFSVLAMEMIIILMLIDHQSSFNLWIVFGKLLNSFQMLLNLMNIFLLLFWITFIAVDLVHSSVIVKGKEFKKVTGKILNNYCFHFLFFFAGVKEQTVSLWSYTNSQLDLYRNPLYWANTHQQQVLIPIASIRHIKLWKSYYCRWNPSMRTQVILKHQLYRNVFYGKYLTKKL